MKFPLEILPHHEQKHESSCVAWGLELILKMHEKIGLDEYPLQNGDKPEGWGFGERERGILKDKYGVETEVKTLSNLTDIEKTMRQELLKGSYPIFAIAWGCSINFSQRPFIGKDVRHVWVSILEGTDLQYRSRSYFDAEVRNQLDIQAILENQAAFPQLSKSMSPTQALLH